VTETIQVSTVSNLKTETDVHVVNRLGISGLYVFLGNIFTLIVGLPLQIYVSRVLGSDGLGVYGLLEAMVATITGLAGLGIGQTVVRYLPAHLDRGEYDNVVGLLYSGGLIVLVVGGSIYAALLLLLPFIGQFFPAAAPYRDDVASMGLLIPIGLLIFFLQQSLRGFREIRQLILGNSVLQLALKAVLTVAAFVIGWRLGGYIFATIVSAGCGAAWLLCALYIHVRSLPNARPSITAITQWCHYAIVNYLGILVLALTGSLDRFLTGAFMTASAVGILVAARQLQNLPERFNQMFLMAGAPLLSSAHTSGNAQERQRIYCLMTYWSVECSLPLILFLLFFGRPVLELYGPQFAEVGTAPLKVLVGAQFFSLLCGPVFNTAIMSGLERHAVFMTGVTAAFGSVLLAVLIPQFGLIGAAFAIAFGTVLLNLSITVLLRCKLDQRWWDKRYGLWLPPAAANLMLGFIISYSPLKLDAFTLFVVLVAMYGSAIGAVLSVGLHPDDRMLLRHIWRRIEALR
jgi:O-antigen/teichoic acid export membrane protein